MKPLNTVASPQAEIPIEENFSEDRRKREVPLVSIGLPVYNGEKFLELTLDSILAQSFENFELIITDNASTDRTQAIYEAYAAQDSRIRYYRNAENLGATKNYNLSLERSRGTYFKWAAHDDLLAPTFLAQCVEVLEKDPSVVVCYCATERIDEDGQVLGQIEHAMRTASEKPHERFEDLLYGSRHAVFGLMQASALRQTSLIQDFADSDGNLLIEFSLLGRLVEIPEVLLGLRRHAGCSTMAYPKPRDRVVWFNPARAHKLHFPAWRALRGYSQALWHFKLSAKERMACYLCMLKWIVLRRLRILGGEIKINLKEVLSRPEVEPM